jgi:ribonuclease R
MEDDYYVFNEKQYCLVGERSRKIYRIGDEVNVKLAKADIANRQIDFLLVEKEESEIKGDTLKTIGDTTGAVLKRNRKKKADEKIMLHIKGKGKKKVKSEH